MMLKLMSKYFFVIVDVILFYFKKSEFFKKNCDSWHFQRSTMFVIIMGYQSDTLYIALQYVCIISMEAILSMLLWRICMFLIFLDALLPQPTQVQRKRRRINDFYSNIVAGRSEGKVWVRSDRYLDTVVDGRNKENRGFDQHIKADLRANFIYREK